MNPHAKETSDDWVDCALTLVVSGIRLAAHSAGAVNTVRCSDRRRAGSVLRERGETADQPRTNYGPRRPHSAHLNDQPSSPANSGSRATTVQPDLRVKGSRVQISPARQVNVGLSHLIRAAFIRPPAHPRLASAPGSWAQIGPTSASTPPQHRARPGDPGEDNGSSPPGLDGQPTMRDVDVTHLQAGHLTDP